MPTEIKKMIDNDTITSVDIENDLNYFYIMRPNEATAAEKESKITLEEIYRLLDSDNAYYNSGWFYKAIGTASLYMKSSGVHAFSSAVSGAAGAAITFVETMRTGLSSNSAKVTSVGKETFEAWDSGAVLQLGGNGFLFNDETNFIWGYNAYYDGAWKYTDTDEASRLYQKNDGSLVFEGAASGTADDPITWLDAFSVSKEGNAIIEGDLTANGELNFNTYETISANTTITLEKTDKLRTIILNGTLTQLTINKGTDVNESNIIKIINNTGVAVTITDSGVSISENINEESKYYFRGSVLYKDPNKNVTVKLTGNVTYVIPEGQFDTYIIHTPTANETLTITPPILPPDDAIYRVTIQNRNNYILNIAGTYGGAVILKNYQQISGFAAAGGQISFLYRIQPNIAGGTIDPRDDFRGNIHANGVTENTVFGTLAPFIPNNGDIMKLCGAMKDIGLGVSLVSCSFAERNSSTRIDIRGLNDSFSFNGFSVVDGNTNTINVSVSW